MGAAFCGLEKSPSRGCFRRGGGPVRWRWRGTVAVAIVRLDGGNCLRVSVLKRTRNGLQTLCNPLSRQVTNPT